jgi:hypothetical protein
MGSLVRLKPKRSFLEMQLLAYPLLSTCSRRAITRKKGAFGRTYQYSPRGTLLERLSREIGMSKEKIYSQLMQEREYLLKQQ